MADNILSGPIQPPASGGKPKQLVVLLHGYGSNGDDLIGLAPYLARALPDAEFMSPNAPERSQLGFGFQWFGLGSLEPRDLVGGVEHARKALDDFIDAALAERGLATANLGLVGFSQGTMMALDRALRRADSAAAIVGFSGMIADSTLRLAKADKHPPILLVHGTADPVVPFKRMGEAEKTLKDAGFPVDAMARPGLVHSVDAEGVQRAAAFLARNLAA